MNDQKKAKWILGASGVILSAVLLTQFETTSDTEQTTSEPTLAQATTDAQFTEAQQEKMSTREKELVALDWTNFEIQAVQQVQTQVPVAPQRRTQRS